jgi:hypothetical protein
MADEIDHARTEWLTAKLLLSLRRALAQPPSMDSHAWLLPIRV